MAQMINRFRATIFMSALSLLALGSLSFQASALALAQIEDAPVKELVEQLSDDDVNVRRDAAYELVRRGESATEVMVAFAKVVDDRDDQVQFQALLGLARAGEAAEPAIDALLGQLKDRSAQIRYRAADALGKIGPAAINPMIEKWPKANENERIGLASALAQIFSNSDQRVDIGTFDFLKKGLEASNEMLQATAAEAIIAVASSGQAADYTSKVVELASHENDAARLVAVQALAELPSIDQSVTEQLQAAVGDSNARIREAAVLATSELKLSEERKRKLLRRALVDEVYAVRAAATAVIGKSGLLTEEFAAEILDAMDDASDQEVLNSLLVALERIGPAGAPLIPRLVELATKKQIDPDQSAKTIAAFGNDSIIELIHILEDQPEVEPIASRCLVLVGNSAKQALLEGLKSGLPIVRSACVSALGTIKPIDDELLQLMLSTFGDSDPSVRSALIKALANAVENDAIEEDQRSILFSSLVEPATEDESESVRIAVAESLLTLQLAQENTESTLTKVLEDESASVRAALLKSLASDPNTLARHLESVVGAIEDKDPAIRAAAMKCFGRLDKKQLDENIAEALRAGLQDADLGVRARATESVAQLDLINDEIVKAFGNNLAGDPDLTFATLLALQQAGENAKELAPTVANLITHDKENLRLAAVNTLPKIQDDKDALVGQLTDALADEAWEVRRSAAVALGQLGKRSKSAIPNLMKMVSNPDDEDFATSTIRTIDAAPKDSVDLLINYLDSDNDRTRLYAIFLLGKLGADGEKALPKLEALLKNDQQSGSRDRRYLQRAIESIRNPEAN